MKWPLVSKFFRPNSSSPGGSRRKSAAGRRALRLECLERRDLLAAVTVSAGQTVRTLNNQFLGVNVNWWDGPLSGQTQQMVQAAGLGFFRMGGGSLSDSTHFNTPPAYPGQGTVASMASFIASVGGIGMVTLNYGSGSPQEAAAELAYLNGSVSNTTVIGMGKEWNSATNSWVSVNWQTAGYWASLRAAAPLAQDDGLNFLRVGQSAPFPVQFYEVGNEIYGGWETDQHGQGGDSGRAHDPATYVAFAKQFATLAQAIAPGISIGIDVDSPSSAWTANVLKQAAQQHFTPGFLSDHDYAQGPGSENDSKLLQASSNPANATSWAARSAGFEKLLTQDFGSAVAANVELLATEFNSVSTNPGKQSTSLVEGLYVADSIGSMLETAYDGDQFWNLQNSYSTSGNNSSSLYGWRQGGDYGLIGIGGTAPASGLDVAYPQYYAEQLLSQMVHAGDTVVKASSNDSNLAVYAVREASDGDLDLLVINKSASSNLTGTFQIGGFLPAAQAQVWQYGEAQDTAQSQTSDGSSALANFTATLSVNGSSFSYVFPKYSMTVLDLSAASPDATPPVTTPPAPSPAQQINLAAAFNLVGITADGAKFSGGLDRGGNALSGTLVGNSLTAGGVQFALGAVGGLNVVQSRGQTISLSAGSFSTLSFLATAVNGNQPNQTFVVHYSDGTSQSFTQSLSDWRTPQSYAGESTSLAMAYRNTGSGGADRRAFQVYDYTLTTNSTKIVSGITLPNNVNVVILAMTAVGDAAAASVAPPTQLLATVAVGDQVDLTWTGSSGAVTGYNVYRGTSSGGESSGPLNSSPLPATATSYQDNSAVAGQTYYYVVQAVNGSAASQASNEARVALASSGAPTQVNLTAAFNLTGIAADGAKSSGGLDGHGNTLSGNLLGTSQTADGVPYHLGAVGGSNVVQARGQTINLPAGSFSTLNLLAIAVNGNQTNQTFVVHYTDGSSQSFTQSLSDWFTPQSYAGESLAVKMAYRNTSTGLADRRSFYLYGYSFALDDTKVVSGITLPKNANVDILAMTLTP